MTSAELLDLFNRLTGRPRTDAILDATKFTWLKDAQNNVIQRLASVAPWVLYPKVSTATMPTMVTSDQNVFTFGVDTNDVAIVPFGAVQIYRKLTDIPDLPLRPDWDYMDEGTQIRLPRNRKYSGTFYWRGVVFPSALDADNAPALNPGPANELTAIRAGITFLTSGNRNPALAATLAARWRDEWPQWCLTWRKQFSRGGVLTAWTLKDVVTPLM